MWTAIKRDVRWVDGILEAPWTRTPQSLVNCFLCKQIRSNHCPPNGPNRLTNNNNKERRMISRSGSGRDSEEFKFLLCSSQSDCQEVEGTCVFLGVDKRSSSVDFWNLSLGQLTGAQEGLFCDFLLLFHSLVSNWKGDSESQE